MSRPRYTIDLDLDAATTVADIRRLVAEQRKQKALELQQMTDKYEKESAELAAHLAALDARLGEMDVMTRPRSAPKEKSDA